MTLDASICGGRGSWTRIPSTASSRVQLVDEVEEFSLRGRVGKLVREAGHSRFAGRLALRADVDGAGRILANQYGGEPGRAAGLPNEIGSHFRNARPDVGSGGLSVDNPRAHAAV